MEKLLCPACQSHNTNRYGHQNSRQRFICRTCQKTCYHERMFLRGIARVFGVSRNTISAWLKTEFLKSPDASSTGPDAGQGQEA